jgi:hypothetical protein
MSWRGVPGRRLRAKVLHGAPEDRKEPWNDLARKNLWRHLAPVKWEVAMAKAVLR